jgi:hypothetical protein
MKPDESSRPTFAKDPNRQHRGQAAPAQTKLEAYGIDAICDDIGDGKSLRAIAVGQGVSIGRICNWIAASPQRSERVRAIRAQTAQLWDEKAEQVLLEVTDSISLGIARELASHYRWRAAKTAPADYGDKLNVAHTGQMDLRLISDDELQRRLGRFEGVTIDENGNLIID